MLAVAACLAEMASMAPTSGGQYLWVAMLSPWRFKKLLSYMNGWLTVAVWQGVVAAGAFFAGNTIDALIILNDPEFVGKRWHTTLFYCGVLLLALFVNTYLIKWLPKLEGVILIVHVLGFFAILIPLVYLTPRSSIAEVFTTFSNNSGWASQSLSFFVGLPVSTYYFFGLDTGAHMAEEVQNASITVSRSLIATVILNGALGFGILTALLFSLSNIDAALGTPTKYLLIEIFAQSAGSAGATIAMCILLFLLTSATVNFLATSSRIMWAFARDNGLRDRNI